MKIVRISVRLICGFTTLSIFGIWLHAFAPIPASWAEFGYYGKFNKVQRIIRAMPELTIIDQWQHRDVSLEDFGFTVQRRDGSTAQIDFLDHSDQMRLSSDEEIRNYIASHYPPPGVMKERYHN